MNKVNDQLYSLINQNSISSIFEITERYDNIVES